MAQLDSVLAAQQIFKSVTNAFSRPCRLYNIKAESGEDVIKELANVFLDSGTSFNANGNAALAADIRETMYASEVEIEAAEFILITDLDSFDAFDKIKTGTLIDPHHGATAIISVPEILGDTTISAEGPGIDGKISCSLSKSVADCLIKSAALDIEYPQGYEILFVTPDGEIMAVPRRVKIYKDCNESEET